MNKMWERVPALLHTCVRVINRCLFMVPLPRNTEQCRDKTICSLSSLLSGLFQALQCAGGWWSRGKFVYYFAKMLLIICHASRHIKAIVCTCHVVVKRESFIFSQYLQTVGTMDLLCSPWQPKMHSTWHRCRSR